MTRNRFESLGLYLPEKQVASSQLMTTINGAARFDLEEVTGIRTRRFRSETEDSCTLAVDAARDCLRNSQYEASDLDVIIFISIARLRGSGIKQQIDPAISLHVKRELGADQALNFDLTNACAGMATGAYVLNSMIASGQVRNGMIVSGECISPIVDTAVKEVTKPTDSQMASLTVGDSGSAFIMDAEAGKDDGIDMLDMVTVGEFSELCLGMPSDTGEGFSMHTQSGKLHTEAIKRLPIFVDKCLSAKEMKIGDFDYYIPHQTAAGAIELGRTVIDRFYKEEGGVTGEVVSIVEEFGNTSSTSHFVALYQYIKEGKIKKGDNVFLLIQASGLVLGCISLKVSGQEVAR